MSTLTPTDIFLVQRGTSLFQVPYSGLEQVDDADLLLVQRGAVQHQVSGLDLRAYLGEAPVTRPWTPADMATAAWFDAADTLSIVVGAGNKVSRINDKSGNGRHAEQGNSALQPVSGSVQQNGQNTLDWPLRDANVTLTFPLFFGASSYTENFAIYVAGIIREVNSSGSGYAPWISERYLPDSTVGGAFAYSRAGNIAASFSFFGAGGTRPIPVDNIDSALVYQRAATIAYRRRSLANSLQYSISASANVLGAAAFNTPTLTSSTIPSASIFFQREPVRQPRASMFELVVVAGDSNMTLENEQKIDGYLAHKWGYAADLPDDHPYKSAPPTK